MGNHEFNALCFHTPNAEGGYLREHSDKNLDQHAATLTYFKKNPGAADRALAWFLHLSALAGPRICANRSRNLVAEY
jgi:hypothetical protein